MTLSSDLPNTPATRSSATPIILDGGPGPNDRGHSQQSPLLDDEMIIVARGASKEDRGDAI